jgi:DnaK suppressor protein
MKGDAGKEGESTGGLKQGLSDILVDICQDLGRNPCSASQLDRHPDFLDQAAAHRDMAVKMRMFRRKSERFYEIRDALLRIENGTYGVCAICGGEIGAARLAAYPATTLCLECQRDQERCARTKTPYYRTVSSLAD